MPYPVSERFREAVKTSHKIATQCKVYDPSGNYVQDLDLVDGNITIDDSASTRWAATLTLTDNTGTLVPSSGKDLLAPKGTEFQLLRGIEFPDGAVELVPLGRYRISNLSIDDSGDGMNIAVQAYDRSRAVALDRFATNGSVAKGTNIADAIRPIIGAAVPRAKIDFDPVTYTVPLTTYNSGDDPWAFCRGLANDAGCDLYFDEVGTCVLRTAALPDPTQSADYSFVEGVDCVMMYVNKIIDDEGSYSHVIVTGESNDSSSTGTIPRGEAYDLDPNSPTYIATFGDVPFFYSSPMITTNAQATAVAQKMLPEHTGLTDRLQLLNIVDCSMRLKDLVYVKRKASNIDATYVVSKLTYPMVHDRGMNISTTERRLLI